MGAVVDLQVLASVFITLFVITDPVGTVPIFLALTGTMTAVQRRRAAWQAIFVSLGVIVAFAVFGQQILAFMHISLPALQGSGGLLLLLVAMELLTGKDDGPDDRSGVNVALVPLGTPLLAGPGAIVATMVYVKQSTEVADVVAIGLGIVAVHLVLWLSLRFAGGIQRVLRDGGVMLVTKIAGLLLAAIAVQMVADAVRAFVLGA